MTSIPKLPSCLAKISHDEVVLIELQGSLEVECAHITESDGKLVGKLDIDEANVSYPPSGLGVWQSDQLPLQNKLTLLIGHHLLEGKIATLTKPLAVLHRPNTIFPKQAGSEVVNHISDGDEMDVDDRNRASPKLGWDVVAIVKRKILFSKRPMPIVGRGTI